ncbi:hypothetical protein ACOAQZ_14970 [Pseudomonas aeruginosa]|uniref:hypothetical protein n=1 Tax=Pseudomonas aeruginosa TaxID=287 RepID=UPI0003BAD26A|nr:hypothetical protein [Pseudomonas aeruginosa]EIY2731911.1 hypothetical protein [Pseudomonas aeruginosa]ERX63564.1 hypothetical protein Q005_01821 [Pseudomonas aeruginosa X24509]MBG4502794.1 hypothetical protein [Pseudomonas aeruginosa]MBI7273378.1 hypothetical protein [Pseudomonas aeruginosa]MBI8314471.1 hypothetical protein [Pseudomonas aeruginosa]
MEHPYKTPEADLAEEKLTARSFLSGGQPLWKAFWLFFAAGFLLLSVAARQAMVAIVDPLMQEATGEHAVALTLWGMVGVELVRLAYLCLSLVVVWRCGRNSRWVAARHASRAVLLALILLTLYSIYLVWALLASP